MSLRILLTKTTCRPGMLLKWAVEWDFDSTPSKINVNISWRTSGKGTDDSGKVFTEDWTPDSVSGQRGFEHQLPRGPISVRGNLISIDWQIECTSNHPKADDKMSFVLSHIDKPVQLSSLIS